MIIQALLNLRPGAQWSLSGDTYEGLNWFDENELPPPTEEELQTEIERLQQQYEYNQYQRNRAAAYPSIADQLDLLYHGGFDVWKEEINKIKEQFPKPEEL